jgi:peptidyl-prolyl cis-trans isomerase B (cyclophilin B)
MNRFTTRILQLLVLTGFLAFAGCSEEPAPRLNNDGTASGITEVPTASDPGTPSTSETPSTASSTPAATPQPAAAPAAAPKSDLKPSIKISTNFGDITLALYDDTPKHRDNMLKLAREGYYNGTLFHRVIPGFMIQGGDPDSKNPNKPAGSLGMGGPGYQIPAEMRRNHFHKRGALAAARTGDGINPNRESSGSQFYIVHGTPQTDDQLSAMEPQIAMGSGIKDFRFTPEERAAYIRYGGAPFLDMQYTVFGEVVSGMEVVDKIAAVEQGPNNQPKQAVTMKVSVIE